MQWIMVVVWLLLFVPTNSLLTVGVESRSRRCSPTHPASSCSSLSLSLSLSLLYSMYVYIYIYKCSQRVRFTKQVQQTECNPKLWVDLLNYYKSNENQSIFLLSCPIKTPVKHLSLIDWLLNHQMTFNEFHLFIVQYHFCEALPLSRSNTDNAQQS